VKTEQQPTQQAAATTTPDLMTGPITSRQQSITEKTAAFLGVPPGKVFDVLRGIWSVKTGQPPLTHQEMMVGMALVARYGLDPFAREIYCTRNKGRIMVIVGIDGWVRVLNRTEDYDGFQVEIAEDSDGKVVSVETAIHSKARKYPAVYKALASEYARLGGAVAGIVPLHMLRIFSFRHAARLFVPLGGCVTEEEARWMGAGVPDEPPATSLDDMADKMALAQKAVADEVIAYQKTEPPFNPPTKEEMEAAASIQDIANGTAPLSKKVAEFDDPPAGETDAEPQRKKALLEIYPPFNPPTKEEMEQEDREQALKETCGVAHHSRDIYPTPSQQAENAEAFAQRIADAVSGANVDKIESDIVGCVEQHKISQTHAAELAEFIADARRRIDHGS